MTNTNSLRAIVVIVAVAVSLAGCHERVPRRIYDRNSRGHRGTAALCLEQHDLGHPSRSDFGETARSGCGLPGIERNIVGRTVLNVSDFDSGHERYVCAVEIAPVEIRATVDVERLLDLIDDPLLYLQVRALVAGVDRNRVFERVMSFNGTRVDFRQLRKNGSTIFSFWVDGCHSDEDDGVVITNGGPAFGEKS